MMFFFVCGFFFPPGWSVVSLHGSDDSTETCRCGRSQLLASSPQILPSGRNISEGATYAFRQIHLKFVVLKIFDNWHFIKLWMQVFSFGPVNNKHIWVGFYFTLGWCLIHLVSTVYIHVMLQIFNLFIYFFSKLLLQLDYTTGISHSQLTFTHNQIIKIILICSILRRLPTVLTRTCMSCSATGMPIPWFPTHSASRQQRRWKVSSILPTLPSSHTVVYLTARVQRWGWE